MSALKNLQTRFGDLIDSEIVKQVNGFDDAEDLQGMLSYQLGYVDERLQPVEASVGKRFRPALCLLACEAAMGEPCTALTAAAGIELLHNFSLIHDDIEDRDPMRRHRPSVWKVWGEPKGINAGDAMFALATRVMTEASQNAETVRQLVREFSTTSLAITQGQHQDMSFEHREDVTSEEYLQMIGNKTGALVGFSLWSGALLAGAGPTTQDKLRSFGVELGRAYQIRDDVMGIWADEAMTGKEPAKDLQNRKKTLPVLFARERARGEHAEVLSRFLARENEDIPAVRRALDSTGAREAAELVAQRYRERALSALHAAGVSESGQGQLETIALELTGQ